MTTSSTDPATDATDELNWLPGPRLAEFPDNSTRVVRHGDESIVVIQWAGEFTAYRNECLHQEMPIHAGYLAEGVLLCPWHNWCYDVATGECQTVPGATLKQFPIRIEQEQLWIGLPPA